MPLTPAEHARRSANEKARQAADPEYRARQSAALRAWWAVPDNRARRTAANKAASIAFWADPANRARHRAALKGRMETPEMRARLSTTGRATWASPELRGRLSRARGGSGSPDPQVRREHNNARQRGSGDLARDDILRLHRIQGGGCAICGRPGTAFYDPAHPRATLALDHDHTTGRTRGLLCASCNRYVGWYEKRQATLTTYLGCPPAAQLSDGETQP